ncbi:MAG TPA: DNA recombination protein RmuC [Solirubrobacterales bacterium]|nr:DNA recombination protein RmuC [Solirubrobacterales bacterium]
MTTLVLAVGLIYLLLNRQEEVAEQPDLSPAIQEAASQATARALSEALPGLLQANKEAREVDVKTAAATLDKREAEIKGLAERIARGQERIEKQVQARGETDVQTRALLEQMGQTIGNLNSETAGLKKALRQPQTRGQWGELQLRRCIEIAGMTEHVDFELQHTLRTEEGSLRPDAIFHLPEGRKFVADSKVPLDAFLDAQEVEVEAERKSHLERHAQQARQHVRALSSKDYQGQFKPGEMPDLVICFIPNEPALHAAFAADPELFDYALQHKVLLVSPTSLIGLLRTMELGWRQEQMVEQATEIAAAAETLHTRFAKFLTDFDTVGSRLSSATKSYNSAVASMEGRLLPQLRKVEDLGIARGKEIEAPTAVEATVREITAPELHDTPKAA